VGVLLEQIAYEAALRALDKQEALVTEVRARAGVLLGASALATSFACSALVVEVVLLAGIAAGTIG
jgi:hypothetical protein